MSFQAFQAKLATKKAIKGKSKTDKPELEPASVIKKETIMRAQADRKKKKS
jgi:hypothetical protein